jgi:uncharacterized repeat protein (TIGR03843 family)
MAVYYRQNTPQLRAAALFDALINNTDRKIGHLLPVTDDSLFLCDHGVTFHADDKLRTVLWQWAGDALTETEAAQIRLVISAFDSQECEVFELLSPEEIEALSFRAHRLLDEGFPFPSEDWPSIPWPPF